MKVDGNSILVLKGKRGLASCFTVRYKRGGKVLKRLNLGYVMDTDPLLNTTSMLLYEVFLKRMEGGMSNANDDVI